MDLDLIAITAERKPMEKYLVNEFCIEVFDAFKKFYPKIGFNPPWIGYFFLQSDEIAGVGGYKGPPKKGKVEIAYLLRPFASN